MKVARPKINPSLGAGLLLRRGWAAPALLFARFYAVK